MGLVGAACLFVINLLYLQIPILSLGFFSGDAGPDGLGILAGIYALAQIVSIFWLILVVTGAGVLMRRMVPLWCVAPLIVVFFLGLPIAWSAYGTFQVEYRAMQERKEYKFLGDEAVWKVLQRPEVKSEIDLLVSTGAPVEKYTDSHDRSIIMPTFFDTRASRTYPMVRADGQSSNGDGAGMYQIVTVFHLSVKESLLPHSVYNVYMGSEQIILEYDGLAFARRKGAERVLVKLDSSDAYASVSLTNIATTSADFVLQVIKGDSDYTISGPVKISEGNGLYEVADATDACALVFKNLASDSVFISANEFCGTSEFPSTIFSGEYRPD